MTVPALIYGQSTPPCTTTKTEQGLFEAIHQADSNRVATLLASGVSANARAPIKGTTSSSNGADFFTCATALMHAAWLGNVQTTSALLAAKADTSARDNWGRLVWAYAVGRDVIEQIEPEQVTEQMDRRLQLTNLLLASGAKLDFNGNGYLTPASHAVEAAAITGDFRILKALIAAGANLNPKDDTSLLNYGMGLSRWNIFRAAAEGPANEIETEIIKTLLAGGANVNAGRGKGTALVTEASGSRIEGAPKRMKLLLAAGADITLPDYSDRTALFAAINPDTSNPHNRRKTQVDAPHDQIEVVKLLLAAGANPKEKRSGSTVLHAAFNTYDYFKQDALLDDGLGLFKVLIDAGADVNAPDDKGKTVLSLALTGSYQGEKIPEGRDRLVAFLIKAGADVNRPGEKQQTPLLLAIRNASDDFVRLLLTAKARVNVQDDDSVTPLLAAVYDNRVNVVRMLIESGVNLDSRDKNGQTPLMAAIDQYWYEARFYGSPDKSVEIIRLLLDAKANVNAKDRNGDTPLMLAARKGRDDGTMKVLIQAGAGLNDLNNDGETALIIAARRYESGGDRSNSHDHPVTADPIESLIAAGADVKPVDQNGDSALTIMAAKNPKASLPIIRQLIAAGKSAGSHCPCVKDLGVAIRRAAGHSSADVVKELISAGADVNGLDDVGRPVLIVAISESGNVEVVRTLLAGGANVNVKDANGETPLIAAIREYLPGENELIRKALRRDPEVIKALLAAGAATDVRARDGHSAMDLAESSGNKSVIDLLKRSTTRG